ncbi:MAG: metallophosphoesterase family protein [Thermodesulfobacteriota bacterium]
MRILAVADIHSRGEKLLLIRETIRQYRPDALVVAGDVSNFFYPRPVLSFLDGLGLPVLVIRGNTDRPVMEKLIPRHAHLHSLHLREFLWNGIRLVGISGTIPLPFRSRICIREKPLRSSLEALIRPGDIVVTHPPPFGTLDEVAGRWHAGSRLVRMLVDTRKPRLLLCGHIHESPGIIERNGSLIVNCSIGKSGSGALVELNQEKIISALLL